MIIGVPTEVMEDEYRVGLTPDKADVLVRAGHEVRVQRGAGEGASFPDEDYEAVGASLVDTPAEVFASDIVAKVKEPQPEEHQHFRDGLVYVVKTSGTKGEPLKRATWTLTGSGSSQICQPPFG